MAGRTARPVLAYPIGDGLYLNISRGCTLHCAFCPKWTAPVVHDYDLTLEHNPRLEEVLAAMGDFSAYEEIVFCGYGEPTLRLELLLDVARVVKERTGTRVRVNTDGLANRVHRRDVTPAFAGLVDAVSISLNAQNQTVYDRHCQPELPDAYPSMLAFVAAVRRHVPEVTLTAIDGLEGVDIAACRRLAEGMGVAFRSRHLNRVG